MLTIYIQYVYIMHDARDFIHLSVLTSLRTPMMWIYRLQMHDLQRRKRRHREVKKLC